MIPVVFNCFNFWLPIVSGERTIKESFPFTRNSAKKKRRKKRKEPCSHSYSFILQFVIFIHIHSFFSGHFSGTLEPVWNHRKSWMAHCSTQLLAGVMWNAILRILSLRLNTEHRTHTQTNTDLAEIMELRFYIHDVKIFLFQRELVSEPPISMAKLCKL